ncbi:MAG: histidine phosphatase family protein [Bacilli bacterium]
MFYFIRHERTLHNRDKRYLGHTDSPILSFEARYQSVLDEALRLYGNVRVYASDLARVVATAEHGLRDAPHVFICLDERLRELHFGRFEGLTYYEANTMYEKELYAWYEDPINVAPPEGETLVQFGTRVSAWAQAALCEQRSNTATFIFTHGGVMQWLAWQMGGEPSFWRAQTFEHGTVWCLTEKQLRGIVDGTYKHK